MRKSFQGFVMLLFICILPAATIAQSATPVTTNPPSAIASAAPVAYIGESGNVIATITVTQIVRPWTEYDEFYEPTAGTEYVAFILNIEYHGRRSDLVVRAYDFRLQDIDGFLLSEAWVDPVPGATITPGTDELVLSPGESGSITIAFQVIKGIELSHLFWSPEYDRMITLIEFR